MTIRLLTSVLPLLSILVVAAPPLDAAPLAVRFTEGVARGFPVLRSQAGEPLAAGELSQVARGDLVHSHLVFRFRDGSLYDETVVFSQRDVFTLEEYRVTQRGPSFPESIEASLDRATGRYDVRYRGDDDSPEELVSGRLALPADVYSGMLGLLMKNLPPGAKQTVQVVVFTPQPRFVTVLLEPGAEDQLMLGERPITATRYLIKPQLGLLASLLVVDPPAMQCWIVGGDAPAFVKFQGPLYFMGPVWRIELN
jgi:hypothetical protein